MALSTEQQQNCSQLTGQQAQECVAQQLMTCIGASDASECTQNIATEVASAACKTAADAYGPEVGAVGQYACGPLVSVVMPTVIDVVEDIGKGLAMVLTFGAYGGSDHFYPGDVARGYVSAAGFIDTWHRAIDGLYSAWLTALAQSGTPTKPFVPDLTNADATRMIAAIGRAPDSPARADGGVSLGQYTAAQRGQGADWWQLGYGHSNAAYARGSQQEAIADLLYAILFSMNDGWGVSRGQQYIGGAGSMNTASAVPLPGRVEDCDNPLTAYAAGLNIELVTGSGPFGIACDGTWSDDCGSGNDDCIATFNTFVSNIWQSQLAALQRAIPIALGRIVAQARGKDLGSVPVQPLDESPRLIAASGFDNQGSAGSTPAGSTPSGSTPTIVTLAAVGAVAAAGYFTWPMWGPKVLRWLR